MKPYQIIIVLCFLIVSSCASHKSLISQEVMVAFDALVKSRQFEITSDMLYPQNSMALQNVLNTMVLQGGNNANAISLIGNSNFLKISGDSITSYLPFYGERFMNVDYGGSDSSIELKGLLKNYQLEQHKDKSYTISFDAQSKKEGFSVFIRLYPNMRSEIYVSGISRSPIRYSGLFKSTAITNQEQEQ